MSRATRRATSGLSRLQRELLARLLVYDDRARAGTPQFGYWGVPVKWLRREGDRTRSGSAAFSRALARLEARGLALRSSQNSGVPSGPRKGYIRTSPDEPAPRRADLVVLTDAGREAAGGGK